ncbi:kynureninase [bacterium]|nr:kynureninase [bacterium]
MSEIINFEATESCALELDRQDSLRDFRNQFHFPQTASGQTTLYLTGNSLGLQPKKTKDCVLAELEDWANLAVEGHFRARHPWLPYHEFCTQGLAHVVGAKPIEVVAMNSLTANLHFLLVSFYRPTPERFKILIESNAFPSDQYAVASQARYHGYDPKSAVVELTPRVGEETLRTEDILNFIEKQGDKIAVILLGGVNYLSGQAFDMQAITAAGHKKGCLVGFDLAHAAGNIKLNLHDWNVDFAAWCSYKYLNSGPGGIAGCFVHERHADAQLPRFEGWWGNNKEIRFKMLAEFSPIGGAETWQLSNPPILQLAALRASLEIFQAATIDALREKSIRLTGYLEFLLETILPPGFCTIVTPRDPKSRGCQLSLRLQGRPREIQKRLEASGVICDFREPDIMRAAPTPLYNSYQDVYKFVMLLREYTNA